MANCVVLEELILKEKVCEHNFCPIIFITALVCTTVSNEETLWVYVSNGSPIIITHIIKLWSKL